MQKINIIGAGIGGLCAAVALLQKGFQVRVYESAAAVKAVGAGLALSGNAIQALSLMDLGQKIQHIGNAFEKMQVLSQNGSVITQNNAMQITKKYGYGSYAVHRADLHQLLINELPEDVLMLGKRCVDIVQHQDSVTTFFEDGSTSKSDILLAFDGIHSVARKKLTPQAAIRYAGYTCWRAVIDKVPSDFDNKLFTETWGAQGRFGITPLTGNRIYWFATKNAPPQDQQMQNFQIKDLMDNFRNYHHPVSEILALTDDTQLIWNDIIDFVPLERYAYGRVLLAGDAAHATTPNMGQGACMAIEDAITIANCLTSSADVAQAFSLFEQKRKMRATRVVKTSWLIGRAAQLENAILIRARNILFRMIPEAWAEKQAKFLYEVAF